MTGKLQPDEVEDCIAPVRQAVLIAGVEDHDLPGFVQPGGVNSVLNIYITGLKRNSAEDAGHGIAEMIRRTSPNSLKPVIVPMIGPLIRAIADRHASAGAVLLALATLLEKAPLLAKPMLPQIQRTALKYLADLNSNVQHEAAVVLGALIPMQPRVDPLITELISSATSAKDDGIKFGVIKALCEVLSRTSKPVGDPQKAALGTLIHQVLEAGQGIESHFWVNLLGHVVPITVRLMSLLLKILSTEAAISLIQVEILDPALSKNSVIALNGLLYDILPSIIESPLMPEILSLSLQAAKSTDVRPSLSKHTEIRTTSQKRASLRSGRLQQILQFRKIKK